MKTGAALRLLLTAACNGCAQCACCHHRCCWVPNGRQRRSACLVNCWRFSRSRPIWAVLKTPLVSDWFLVNMGFYSPSLWKMDQHNSLLEYIATNKAVEPALIWFWIIFPSAALVPRIQHMCSLQKRDCLRRPETQLRNQVVSKFWTSEILGLSWYHHFWLVVTGTFFPPIIYSTG